MDATLHYSLPPFYLVQLLLLLPACSRRQSRNLSNNHREEEEKKKVEREHDDDGSQYILYRCLYLKREKGVQHVDRLLSPFWSFVLPVSSLSVTSG